MNNCRGELAVELDEDMFPAGTGDDTESAVELDTASASRGHFETHTDVGQSYPEILDHLIPRLSCGSHRRLS